MENVHVGRGLDQDQRIFRYLSFYDLIELLTFSQISFACTESRPHEPVSPDEEEAVSPDATSLAHQGWTLLHQEGGIDWHAPDMSQPRICLVSSVGALSQALFTSETTNVFIERTYRAVQGPSHAPARLAAALPLLQDDTVSVIVSFRDDAAHPSQRRGSLRLLVDLKTLLLGVIVSPDASIRFLELTSKLVQQATSAFVSRASPSSEAHHARGFRTAGRQYPAYPHAIEQTARNRFRGSAP